MSTLLLGAALKLRVEMHYHGPASTDDAHRQTCPHCCWMLPGSFEPTCVIIALQVHRRCTQTSGSRARLRVSKQVVCQRCQRAGEVALPAGEGGGSRRVDAAGSCAHCHHDWWAPPPSAPRGIKVWTLPMEQRLVRHVQPVSRCGLVRGDQAEQGGWCVQGGGRPGVPGARAQRGAGAPVARRLHAHGPAAVAAGGAVRRVLRRRGPQVRRSIEQRLCTAAAILRFGACPAVAAPWRTCIVYQFN